MHSPGVQAQHEAGLSLPGSSSEEPQKPLALRMSHNFPKETGARSFSPQVSPARGF